MTPRRKLPTLSLYERAKRGWVELASSWLRDAHYTSKEHRLMVHFKDGTGWVYLNVHPNTARAFFAAPSHGKFVHRKLNAHENRRLGT